MMDIVAKEYHIWKYKRNIRKRNFERLQKVQGNGKHPNGSMIQLESQFESVLNLEFQPKFGIQLGISISMGINLGECTFTEKECFTIPLYFLLYQFFFI